MFKTLAASAALLLCGGATWSDAIPPERFQGEATVKIRLVPAENVNDVCKIEHPPGVRVIACYLPRKHLIVAPLPGPYAAQGEYFARIFTHEIGHAAFGWSANHEE